MTDAPPKLLIETLATQSDRIAGYLLSIGARPGEAEDIVQEVAVAASTANSEPDNPLAWLLAVARRRFIDHLRRQSTRQQRELPFDDLTEVIGQTFAEADPVADHISAEIEQRALALCLSRLAPQARRIIDFHYWQNLDVPAIAQALQWRENAVRVALSKIKRTLADCLQRQLRH